MISFLRSILSNLATLLLAFVLAVIIWINAIQIEDPIKSQFLQVPVEFIGQPDDSRLLSSSPQNVQVVFEGPTSIVNEVSIDDFGATVDLSQVSFGEEVAVDVNISSNIDDITILSQSPEQVNVLLDRLVTRDIPVELEVRGTVARGHEQGEPLIDPEFITVVGTASQVEPVDFARVTVFLNNDRETVAFKPQPIFYNRQGRIVSPGNLELSTEQVEVTIPINEAAGVAEKLITVDWNGEPAPGYRLLSIEVDPPSVLVEGRPTRLNLLNRVQTEPIDITGLQESFTQQVALDLPEGVSLVEVEEIFVTVEIEPLMTTSVYNRQVQLRGLGPMLTATVRPDNVSVVLFGPLPVLNTLREDEISAELDLFGLTEGTHNLTPTVDFPDRGIELRSVQPNLVTIEITKMMTATETITEADGLFGGVVGWQIRPFSSHAPQSEQTADWLSMSRYGWLLDVITINRT